MLNFVICLLFLALSAVSGDFPADIARCPSGDDDCFTRTTQAVMKKYFAGSSDLNISPFDPLHVKSLTLDKNPASPVNLELKFKNLDLIGLKTAQVKQVKGFNFGERSVFEAVVPEFILKGDYISDGQILILPIKGKGKSVITCKNLLLKYTFDLKPVDKNGKVFAQLEHVKLEFNPERVQYHFEGLFNGDKALSDSMNKFLNENWLEIYRELQGGFAKGISLVIKQMVNNVLSKYPYEFLILKRN